MASCIWDEEVTVRKKKAEWSGEKDSQQKRVQWTAHAGPSETQNIKKTHEA